MKKSIYLLFAALALAISGCGRVTNNSITKRSLPEINTYDKVTLYDLGTPDCIIGNSYYSNGKLTYTHSGCIAGYTLTDCNVLFDVELTFTGAFEWPSWFSINVRASDFDRTQSPNLTQKGYSFLVRPSGFVTTWKEGVELTDASGTFTDGFVTDATNNVVFGAVEDEDNIRIIFIVNDTTIIDYIDSTDPLTTGGSCFYFCADNVVSTTIDSNNVPQPEPLPEFDRDDYYLASFVDYGTPTIADGSGTCSYSDGLINYTNAGGTIGYNLPDSNVLMDFYLTFYNTFASPSWLSLSLRASGFDRTHSAGLACIGYVIILSPTGAVTLSKDRTGVAAATFTGGFLADTKYDVQVGAVNYEDGIRVVLYVDDELVLDYFDDNEPLLNSGNWFNVCADMGVYNVSAYLEAKREAVVPEYPTYTFSTLRGYPTLAGANPAKVDKHNNVLLTESGQTVGFYESLKDFSLAGNYYFYEVGDFCNLWISIRGTYFDRASSMVNGYTFRVGQVGAVEIYKNGTGLLASGYYGISAGNEYYIEFGAVDYSPTRTRIFISINNQIVAEVFDDNDPWQNAGWILFNTDGLFTTSMGSAIKTFMPLKSRVTEKQDIIECNVYFNSAFDLFDTTYERFEERVLESITIGKYNVIEFNSLFHGKKNEENVRAVDVYTVANRLVISIQKNLFNSLDEEANPDISSVVIHKTGSIKGFITPQGYILKNSYTIEL